MTTNLFHQVEGESVILRSKGTFTQNDVYQRNNELFAKKGSGFIRLMQNEGTSQPSVMVEHLTLAAVKVGEFGRLCLK